MGDIFYFFIYSVNNVLVEGKLRSYVVFLWLEIINNKLSFVKYVFIFMKKMLFDYILKILLV